MVSIKFDGICEGCMHADLVLDSYDSECFYAQGNVIERHWVIACIHHDVCDKWTKKMKRINDGQIEKA